MGILNPYYWVDDHPLLYGNNGSLDPGTYNLFVSHRFDLWPADTISMHSAPNCAGCRGRPGIARKPLVWMGSGWADGLILGNLIKKRLIAIA